MHITHSLAKYWCDVLFRGSEEQIAVLTSWFGTLPEGAMKAAIIEVLATGTRVTLRANHPFSAVWEELMEQGALPESEFLVMAKSLAVEAAAYVRDARMAQRLIEAQHGWKVEWEFQTLQGDARVAIEHLASEIQLPCWQGFNLAD